MINRPFPSAFKSYRPQSQKVYGVVLVSDKNRVLVVKGTKTGKYSFPKGHINPSETVRSCAYREFNEETGLDVNNYQEIGYQQLYAGGYYFFQTSSEDVPSICRSDEISSACWMSMDDLRDADINIDIVFFLKKVSG
jgi:8-oxo-dGTP pyrophosphatase MutT (NUDIX family)